MTKTVSARIPNKRHDALRERCNQLGCTINEYIEHVIEFTLDGQSEFDFELNEPDIIPLKPTVNDVSEPPKPKIRFIHE